MHHLSSQLNNTSNLPFTKNIWLKFVRPPHYVNKHHFHDRTKEMLTVSISQQLKIMLLGCGRFPSVFSLVQYYTTLRHAADLTANCICTLIHPNDAPICHRSNYAAFTLFWITVMQNKWKWKHCTMVSRDFHKKYMYGETAMSGQILNPQNKYLLMPLLPYILW